MRARSELPLRAGPAAALESARQRPFIDPRPFVAALACCAGAAFAQASAADAEAGRRAYTSYCVRCHGINLVSTSGAYFDLRTFPRDDKERFLRSVKEGKRAMPAWDGIVKPQDIEAIWAYIGAVNGWGDSPAPK